MAPTLQSPWPIVRPTSSRPSGTSVARHYPCLVPWFRRVRLQTFEIPIEGRVVRIRLDDGIVEFEDPDGEMYPDGWSTVQDLVRGLQEKAKLPPDQARVVSEEVIRRWREQLGHDYRFEYFRET
jgi:hypothetical protein